jgi:hypothetical protein
MADFSKVAATVPGIEGVIKSAPTGSKNAVVLALPASQTL